MILLLRLVPVVKFKFRHILGQFRLIRIGQEACRMLLSEGNLAVGPFTFSDPLNTETIEPSVAAKTRKCVGSDTSICCWEKFKLNSSSFLP